MSFQGTLKVGIPVSLSGQFQVQGKQALSGLQAWATDVNDAGGLALDRLSELHPVAVVHCDDQSTADGVRRAATRLIAQDRIDLLFGPLLQRFGSSGDRSSRGPPEGAVEPWRGCRRPIPARV